MNANTKALGTIGSFGWSQQELAMCLVYFNKIRILCISYFKEISYL
jgi:hypothetical protein